MEGFDPGASFGYEVSKRYDADSHRGDEEETVAFLARLAGRRDALELASGCVTVGRLERRAVHRQQLAPRQRLRAIG
jgi:hypothetical protein